MRLLVTGGAGFIGAHLARADGHEVTVLDDLSTGSWTGWTSPAWRAPCSTRPARTAPRRRAGRPRERGVVIGGPNQAEVLSERDRVRPVSPHGSPTTLLELVGALEQVTGRTTELRHIPARVGDVRRSCADVTALRTLFADAPQVALAAGLAQVVSSARDQLRSTPA